MTSRPGFTLLEVLTVIAIIGVLTAIGWPSVSTLKQSSSLTDATQSFVSILQTAQAEATANQGGSTVAHTVHRLSGTSYSLIAGTNSTAYTLPNGVTFTAAWPDVPFAPRTGTTTATTISLTNGGVTKNVAINSLGIVNVN